MNECLFCKILNKEIPAEIVYQDENVIGFKDIAPQAKHHFVFIHRHHTRNVVEMAEQISSQQYSDFDDLFKAISKFTSDSEMLTDGFRVVVNTGPHAGQTVFHTHFHVLGGEPLGHFGRAS